MSQKLLYYWFNRAISCIPMLLIFAVSSLLAISLLAVSYMACSLLYTVKHLFTIFKCFTCEPIIILCFFITLFIRILIFWREVQCIIILLQKALYKFWFTFINLFIYLFCRTNSSKFVNLCNVIFCKEYKCFLKQSSNINNQKYSVINCFQSSQKR